MTIDTEMQDFPTSTSLENEVSRESIFSTPSLEELRGTTYVNGSATLAHQTAYALSPNIFLYADGLSDRDPLPVLKWHSRKDVSPNGHVPAVRVLQTRSGAGALVLGHSVVSEPSNGKIYPNSLFASSSTILAMRPALATLSTSYDYFHPLVTHIAAIDSDVECELVPDYVTVLRTARDTGLAVVVANHPDEIQHLSILSTLFANILPTVHLYDGFQLANNLVQIAHILETRQLRRAYDTVLSQIVPSKAAKIDQLDSVISIFNRTLITSYSFFSYVGHPYATTILVTIGSKESSLSSDVAKELASQGQAVGVVVVRLYQPFSDQHFLDAIPPSTHKIAVLGQVYDKREGQSILFEDVLGAIMSSSSSSKIEVLDIPYERNAVWQKEQFFMIFEQILTVGAVSSLGVTTGNTQALGDDDGMKIAFWDLDESASSFCARRVAERVATSTKIEFNELYDNFSQAGIVYSELRTGSQDGLADVAVVGDIKVLNSYDVIATVKFGGKVLLKIPSKEEQVLERKLSGRLRRQLAQRSDLEFWNVAPVDVNETRELEMAVVKILGSMVNVDREQMKVANDIEGPPTRIDVPLSWSEAEGDSQLLPRVLKSNSYTPNREIVTDPDAIVASDGELGNWHIPAQQLLFKESHVFSTALRPELSSKTWRVKVQENKRLTPQYYDRNVFHIEFDTTGTDLKYAIGEALGIHTQNDSVAVDAFLSWLGVDPLSIISLESKEHPGKWETRSVRQWFTQQVDIFGKPGKKFYESLSFYAKDEKEKKRLLSLGGNESAAEFKKRMEVDMITFFDVLMEFSSARPGVVDLINMIPPIKRREYSIASSQQVHPNSVHLLVVEVNWLDPQNRQRFGLCTRYLSQLPVGSEVVVSVKPSVMKLPPDDMTPIILAGLGTGLAPARAFIEEKAWRKAQGKRQGEVFLYMGSRHQREEYLYGEEWEAYRDAGIITLLGHAFSRDQPEKVYIQDVMRGSISDLVRALVTNRGSFFLCGPTWPVPDVTRVLQDVIEEEARIRGIKKIDSKKEIEVWKDDGRYVLEVY